MYFKKLSIQNENIGQIQLELLMKMSMFQAVMIRKKQGKVIKRIKVDDEGLFLAQLKEKVCS